MFDLKQISDIFRQGGDDAKVFLQSQFSQVVQAVQDIQWSLDNLDKTEDQFKEIIVFRAGELTVQRDLARQGWNTEINRIAFVLDVAGNIDLYAGEAQAINLIFSQAAVTRFADGMNGYPGIMSGNNPEVTAVSTQPGVLVLYGSRVKRDNTKRGD